MNKKMLRLATLAGTIAAASVLTAACSGDDDDDDTGGGDVVLKDDNTAANFACNGTFDGAAGSTSAQTITFLVEAQTAAGTNASPDTYIGTFNEATAATNGNFAVSDAGGNADLTLATNSFHHILAMKDGSTLIPTYNYDVLVTTSAETPVVRAVDQGIVNVILGVLTITATDVAGKTSIAGAVYDCDGDVIQNATIQVPVTGGGVAKRCGETDHGFPCIAYFAGATPSKTALATDESGRFAIVGAEPGDLQVTAWGVLTDGAAAEQIGVVDMYNVADAVSIASTRPLPGAN